MFFGRSSARSSRRRVAFCYRARTGVGHADGVVCAHLGRSRRDGQVVEPENPPADSAVVQAHAVGLLLLSPGERVLLVRGGQHHQGVGLEGRHVPGHDAWAQGDGGQPLLDARGHALLERDRQDGQGLEAAGHVGRGVARAARA
eukprot:1993448-Pleurochrysis_carterae.AAC.3